MCEGGGVRARVDGCEGAGCGECPEPIAGCQVDDVTRPRRVGGEFWDPALSCLAARTAVDR